MLYQLTIIIIHIHLHLPDILMGKFSGLKIDKNITFQESIVKNEINIEMIPIRRYTFLASNKDKSVL